LLPWSLNPHAPYFFRGENLVFVHNLANIDLTRSTRGKTLRYQKAGKSEGGLIANMLTKI